MFCQRPSIFGLVHEELSGFYLLKSFLRRDGCLTVFLPLPIMQELSKAVADPIPMLKNISGKLSHFE